MVDAPNAKYTTDVWQAALADPETEDVIYDQVSKKSVLARLLLNQELEGMKGWESDNKMAPLKDNGYKRKHCVYSTLSSIQRIINTTNQATSGAIAVADAISTTVDLGLSTNGTHILTGDYGTVYGAMTFGLEQEIRGSAGGKNINEWIPQLQKHIAQSISDTLQVGMYSDGTSDKIDGIEYWVKATGVKWNSSDIAGTDTFLQGQNVTSTTAAFTKAKLRLWHDTAMYGFISDVDSPGLKPNVCLCDTATVRLMKGWIDDKQVIDLTVDGRGNMIVALGTPNDFVIFDGVCYIADVYIDSIMGNNTGQGYMFNLDDWQLITHKDYGFTGIDALSDLSVEAPAGLEHYVIPSYLKKEGYKKTVLINLYHKHPRHLLKWTRTA